MHMTELEPGWWVIGRLVIVESLAMQGAHTWSDSIIAEWACVCVDMCLGMRLLVKVWLFLGVCACMNVCVGVCLQVSVCVCVNVFVFLNHPWPPVLVCDE